MLTNHQNQTTSWTFLTLTMTLLLALTLGACTSNSEKRYLDTTLSFEERADALVKEMTLEEKVGQMVYESPAIERLGIPAYNWWNECLHGVGRAGIATVFPQAVGMASMWDNQQMFKISNAISDEARAKHHHFVAQNKRGIYQGLTFWTPNINIFRDPRWGRGMETYGEDPYLTGELALKFIKGLQGDDSTYYKVIATAKHFVMHSGPEATRHKFDAVPVNNDFNETYTPHFKKVIQQSGVYSVMCAYNRLNHKPCCGSTFIDSLLRVHWGFKGYIVSDCWAVQDFYTKGNHEVVPTREQAAAMAVKAGTDLNCGDSYPALVEAVKQGYITEAEIDVCVKRLMLARLKLGMFDPDEKVKWSKIPYSVVDSKEHQALAIETASKSMVLLKNDKNMLPLSKDIRKIAVIGPNADNLDALLGNYNGYPSAPKTPLTGIREKLQNAEVTYAQGCRLASELPYMTPIPQEVLFTDSTLKENGLKAEYFNNSKLEGQPLHLEVDKNINFLWWDKAPYNDLNAAAFSARWTGILVPAVTGEYAIGGDGFSGYSVFIDDSLICTWNHVHHPRLLYEMLHLKAGQKYRVRVDYIQNNSEYANVKLLWDAPGQKLKEEAVATASKADLVVMCMGLSPLLEGEEMKVKVAGFKEGDREEINIPAIQTDLIKAIMALKKPTVLVLLNGSALAFNWEAQNVPAILEAWYPGQAGGTAIADILFGDYNPAGRLPVTFYKSASQLPAFDDYSMKGRTYRYFSGDALYQFGHGLSYTSFSYSNLIIADEINAGDDLTVSVEVTNTGKWDGDEVVQLYVSHPEYKGSCPIRSLQGFKRIHLKSGEKQTVTFTMKADQLATFNANGEQVVEEGVIRISIGGSQPSAEAISSRKVIEATTNIKGSHICL
jgi:beta-glucosidase